MSLSIAANAAQSGLQLSSRAAQLVAGNIANSQTPGYGVRSLSQAAQVLGGTGSGVSVTGVSRHADPALQAEFRDSLSRSSGQEVLTDFWDRLAAMLGNPGDLGAFDSRFTRLEAALSQAVSAPSSLPALQQVALAADDLAAGIRQADSYLQQARDQADGRIANDIDILNRTLGAIARLNDDIQRQTITGGDPHALTDQRQVLIDQVAAILPVTEIPRRDGRVMLLGADGTILLDREAASFSFVRTMQPRADERAEVGGVATIALGSRQLGADAKLFGSGSLGAALELRDRTAPQLQDQLDVLAAELVDRFAQADVDPTLPSGQQGLFVDQSVTPAQGSAGTLALNPAIDPTQPATVSRLRDGLYASVPGPVGENGQLARLLGALSAIAPSPDAPAGSMHDRAQGMMAGVLANLDAAEADHARLNAHRNTLEDMVKANGVDSDYELQRLMMIEKAYAANARVLAVVDSMLRRLMEI